MASFCGGRSCHLGRSALCVTPRAMAPSVGVNSGRQENTSTSNISPPSLSAVLYNTRHELAALDDGAHLLGNRPLLEIALIARRHADVERARLGRDNLGRVDARLGEVDLARVGRVDEDGRDRAEDLDGEGRGRGDGELRDDRLEEDRGLGAVDWADQSRKSALRARPRAQPNVPMLIALTLPLIWMTLDLQPKICTVWLISVLSRMISWLFSWYSWQVPRVSCGSSQHHHPPEPDAHHDPLGPIQLGLGRLLRCKIGRLGRLCRGLVRSCPPARVSVSPTLANAPARPLTATHPHQTRHSPPAAPDSCASSRSRPPFSGQR